MRKEDSHAPIRSWASERLSDEIRRSLDRLARSDDVHHIAVMPDVHLARDVCVGTAFATSVLLYPDAIGGDIGCGMSAAALDAFRSDLPSERAQELLRAIREAVPIRRQQAGAAEALAGLVPPPDDLSLRPLQSLANADGPHQIGTLGTGNHFLELQYDDDEERLWLMVHSGSRGLGQAIRAAHVLHADRVRSGLMCLDVTTPAGNAYLRDMRWARQFAAASRWGMLLAAGAAAHELLGWRLLEDTLFDCDHNHINEEEHSGTRLFIHRKGAMAAWPDEPGIVPGSMAAPSFHVTGRGVPAALCSSAHGAGRAMSRSEARRQVSRNRLRQELRNVYVDARFRRRTARGSTVRLQGHPRRHESAAKAGPRAPHTSADPDPQGCGEMSGRPGQPTAGRARPRYTSCLTSHASHARTPARDRRAPPRRRPTSFLTLSLDAVGPGGARTPPRPSRGRSRLTAPRGSLCSAKPIISALDPELLAVTLRGRIGRGLDTFIGCRFVVKHPPPPASPFLTHPLITGQCAVARAASCRGRGDVRSSVSG